MSNHTVDCAGCGEDLRTGGRCGCVGTSEVAKLIAERDTAVRERDDLKASFKLERDVAIMTMRAFEKASDERDALAARLRVLQRYHSGDGTVTREQVIDALREDKNET
jgi:hypothetical protein